MCRQLLRLVSFVLVLGVAGNASAELVGHWRFDEGSGTIANDASGNGNHGTLNGDPKWVVGHFGGALEFDGTDDWIDCGNDSSLDLTAWTVAFWLNVNQNKDFNGFVIKGLDAAENYEVLGFADGSLHFPITHTDGSRTFVNSSPGMIVEGEWAHFAYTYDPAEGRRLYKNGSLVFEDTESKTPQASTTSLAIGNEQPMSRYVDGIMDDVRIYNRALSEAELVAAMTDTPVTQAYGPQPKDGGMIDQTAAILTWQPGDFAISHDVYFGDDAEVVGVATPEDADLYAGRLGAEMLTVGMAGSPFPDALVPGQTYYWRVDEVNDLNPDGPWKGNVWSFRTKPLIAYQPYPVDGMKNIDPNQDLTWEPGSGTLFHTIYIGQTFDEVAGAVAGGWMQVDAVYDPGTLELDTTYYWRVDGFKGIATDKGEVWSFTTRGEGGGAKAEYFASMALAGDPVLTQVEPSIDHTWGNGEIAAGLTDDASARWRANLEAPFTEPVRLITTSDDGVRLYVDGRLVIDNWTDHGTTDNSATIDMVAGQVHLVVMEWYENTGGAVAQLSWESDTIPRQIIPQGWLQLPLKATGPSPANGAPHADQSPILSWAAGDDATGHHVYFGDDAEAVTNADTSTAGTYRGQQAADVTTYNPGPLEWGKTYYWRVDEVTPDGVLTGALWSFTTADFIVIDDFESYDNEVGSRPFEVWIDGYGFTLPEPGHPGNGSNAAVGHDVWSPQSPHYNGLLMETQNVHGGFQSMPVDYNNVISPFYSEIERTWTAPQNWTVNDVDTLTLHVSGGATNDADRFYVTLTDSSGRSATVDVADTSVLTSRSWSVVSMPLADFTAVNAAAITKMLVGLGNPPAAGGAGSLLFDDFRVTKAP